MRRFFGLMPSREIERGETFKTKDNQNVIIDAGPHGWTIIYADNSADYKDVDDTTDNNFNSAYNLATSKVGELKRVDYQNYQEEAGER